MIDYCQIYVNELDHSLHAAQKEVLRASLTLLTIEIGMIP